MMAAAFVLGFLAQRAWCLGKLSWALLQRFLLHLLFFIVCYTALFKHSDEIIHVIQLHILYALFIHS